MAPKAKPPPPLPGQSTPGRPALFTNRFLAEAAGGTPLTVIESFIRNLFRAAARIWHWPTFQQLQGRTADQETSESSWATYGYICCITGLPFIEVPGVDLAVFDQYQARSGLGETSPVPVAPAEKSAVRAPAETSAGSSASSSGYPPAAAETSAQPVSPSKRVLTKGQEDMIAKYPDLAAVAASTTLDIETKKNIKVCHEVK
jgi:hypothetical protein